MDVMEAAYGRMDIQETSTEIVEQRRPVEADQIVPESRAEVARAGTSQWYSLSPQTQRTWEPQEEQQKRTPPRKQIDWNDLSTEQQERHAPRTAPMPPQMNPQLPITRPQMEQPLFYPGFGYNEFYGQLLQPTVGIPVSQIPGAFPYSEELRRIEYEQQPARNFYRMIPPPPNQPQWRFVGYQNQGPLMDQAGPSQPEATPFFAGNVREFTTWYEQFGRHADAVGMNTPEQRRMAMIELLRGPA
jgi:hypothetical protein